MRALLRAVLVMLVTAACAPSALGTPTPASSAVASPSSNPQAQPAIDAAVRDLTARVNVASSDVHVEQAEAREWSDASLGCPQPGQLYAQVITPGYLIVLSAGGQRYEYHADARGRAILCR
jgi:hypothetical protein